MPVQYDPPEVLRYILRRSRAERSQAPQAPLAATQAQRDLETGGAAARLRARGCEWQDVADALGIADVGRLRALAGRYLLWLGCQAHADGAGDALAPTVTDARPDAERVTLAAR